MSDDDATDPFIDSDVERAEKKEREEGGERKRSVVGMMEGAGERKRSLPGVGEGVGERKRSIVEGKGKEEEGVGDVRARGPTVAIMDGKGEGEGERKTTAAPRKFSQMQRRSMIKRKLVHGEEGEGGMLDTLEEDYVYDFGELEDLETLPGEPTA
jgi:hypothetical protein